MVFGRKRSMRKELIENDYKKTSDCYYLAGNAIIFLFVVILIFQFLGICSVLFGNIILLFLGILSIMISIMANGFSRQKYFFSFLFCYISLGFLCFIYNRNADIQELIWPFGFMGVALLLLNVNISYRLFSFLFYSFSFLIILLIIVNGSPDAVEGNSSRNAISQFELLLFSLVCISAFENRKSVTLLYPTTIFVVCVAAIGRSGILMSLIILFLFLFVKLQDGVSKRRKIITLILTIGLSVFAVYIAYRIFPDMFESAILNFKNRQIDSARTFIWHDYLEKTNGSVLNVLLGSNISGTEYLNKYSHNLHNSFFMLHAKYGVGGLILIGFLLIKSIFYFLKNKNFYFLIPLLAMLFRMCFDYTNFNSDFDIVLVFFLLFPHYSVLNARTYSSRFAKKNLRLVFIND